jgi:hypothetical protein
MVVVALAMPVAATFAIAGTATAASPYVKVNPVSCSSLSGTVNSTTLKAKGTLDGCNDPKNTGGGGTFTGKESKTTATTTWASGHGTTTFSNVAYTPVSPNACPSPDIEYKITGTVSGGTGAALKSIPKGWTLQIYICVNTGPPITFSLLAGTLVEIGSAY